MIDFDSIQEDISHLNTYSINNPRRLYYSSKISSSIRIGYDRGELSKEDADSLLLRYRESLLDFNFFNDKIVKSFKTYYNTGGNLLGSVSLKDILRCRVACTTLKDFYEKGGVTRLCNSSVLSGTFKKLKEDFCKLAKAEESSNDFYDSLFTLENVMWTSLFYNELEYEIKEFSEKFFNIRRKFLELDKKFYYQPDGEFTNMSNSSQFTTKELDDLKSTGYMAYHKEKYTIELLTLIYKNPFDKLSCVNRVIDMINNSNLQKESKDLLSSIMMNTMEDYHVYGVADVLNNITLNSIPKICYFYENVFDKAYEFSVEFCKYMSDKEIIALCIRYACVYSLSRDVIGNKFDVLKLNLKDILDQLVEADIITIEEQDKIIESAYRRISGK